MATRSKGSFGISGGTLFHAQYRLDKPVLKPVNSQMPDAHPDFQRLYNLLKDGELFGPWKGDVLRSAPPRWVSRPYRFTGTGALLAGGRWNVLKLIPAVYLSTSVETLNAEAESWARRHGFKVADLKPQTRITVHVEMQAVLDLTLPKTRTQLRLTAADLKSCDWKAEQNAGREALTQAIGRAAFESMSEGIVAPSSRHPGGINVILFSAHRRDGSVVRTGNEADIPLVHGL
jgi:RES domain-containing protein